jgi:hypothetical protein
MQRVHQKEFPGASAAAGEIDGKSAQKDDRQLRVSRQPLAEVGRQFVGGNCRRRERVEAQDPGREWFQQDEGGGDPFCRVLARLLLQILIKLGAAARELRAFVAPGENFDMEWSIRVRQSALRLAPKLGGGTTQPGSWSRGIQQR